MWKSNPIFKFFSSLKLAVLSILTLSAVLTYGTVAESLYGMRGAHALVYGSWWFGGVLFFLGLNVFCAAMSRYPWKRHQTGFVITHSGILIILLGSVLTQRFGVDGNLPVLEGQQENEVLLNDLRLTVQDDISNQAREYELREAATKQEGRLLEISLSPEHRLVIKKFLPRIKMERVIEASVIPGLGSPAVHFELFNSRFQIEEWLLTQHPSKPAELNLGPAIVSFKKFWTSAEEENFLKGEPSKETVPKTGYLLVKLAGKEYRVNIDEHLKRWKPVSGSGLELQVERYLPYAVVQGNELVNRSAEPRNPAVQLLVRKTGGAAEKHTIFALFPEFATLHKSHSPAAQERTGAKFTLVANMGTRESLEMVGTGRGELQFAQSQDGTKLFYRALGADGRVTAKGDVKIGESVPTGWMDLQFRVSEWHQAAIDEQRPMYVDYISGESNFLSTIYIEEESGRSPASTNGRWLLEGETQTISFAGRKLTLNYTKEKKFLPFHIFLDKFTVGMDPGTQKAGTYESRVTVRDPKASLPTSAQISMNEPLDYGGYTFYQASYQLQEGRPPVSVFAVNYDPGRWVKYLGSIIMCLGICLMFYMNPHYWNVLLGGRKGSAS